MKTPRRKFLQTAAFVGAAAAVPGMVTSCATGPHAQASGTAASAAAGPPPVPSPREVLAFDTDWRFLQADLPGAQTPAIPDTAWTQLDLPHDWSIALPFDPAKASCAGFLPGGIGWYRKTFRLPGSLTGKRVFIMFDGVYNHSEVWLNGHSLGKRPYGYISFQYDLTPHLAPTGSDNVLAVRVDHSEDADTRWYNGSGIYRHVWLIGADEIHIPTWGTFVTTPAVSEKSATISIATKVRNDSHAAKEVMLTSIVHDERKRALARATASQSIDAGKEFRFEQSAELANPQLWSPEAPHLYSVIHEVRAEGKLVDQFETPFGVRWFAFDVEKGFHLNGVKTLIKGVCVHHDAGCLGAAFLDRAWERRLQLLKELGCNAIRMSHNPPAPQLLDMCDRMGFLVMDEAFDEWARPKKKWITGRNNGEPGSQGYAKDFQEWSIRDIQAMVERDKNHPSIILWSIGNEIDYPRDPYYDPSMQDNSPARPQASELPGIATKLVKAIKELDTTRPVTAALANISASNLTGYPECLDVVGYNYTETAYRPDHAKYPARKIIGSENSHNYPAWKAVEDLPYVSGQFLWTGIDYIGEAGTWQGGRGSSAGVIDEAGFRKPSYYFRQSLWSDKPMVFLAARLGGAGGGRGGGGGGGNVAPTWNLSVAAGANGSVVCYTNCEKVELLLNGKSIGERPMTEAQNRVLAWQVPYAPGTLKAIGKNQGREVCSFELKTAGEAKRIQLSPDLTPITADGCSLSHVEVSVTDEAGNLVYAADHQLNFEISGPGRIIGVDTGDMRSHESFKAPTRKAFHGKCLVIIQSTTQPGQIRLAATASPLLAAETVISVAKRG